MKSMWIILAGFFVGVFALSAVGCSDVDDDVCVSDAGTPCEEDSEPSQAPRDAKILPYKPGAPAVIEQALSATPNHVYTPETVELSAADKKSWPLSGGSFVRWNLAVRSPGGWTATFNPQFVDGSVGVSLPGWTCPQGIYKDNKVTCTHPLYPKGKTFTCPYGRVPRPTAYDFGSLVYYGFDSKYSYTPSSLKPMYLVPEWYHPQPGNPKLERMLTCYYRLPQITIGMKP